MNTWNECFFFHIQSTLDTKHLGKTQFGTSSTQYSKTFSPTISIWTWIARESGNFIQLISFCVCNTKEIWSPAWRQLFWGLSAWQGVQFGKVSDGERLQKPIVPLNATHIHSLHRSPGVCSIERVLSNSTSWHPPAEIYGSWHQKLSNYRPLFRAADVNKRPEPAVKPTFLRSTHSLTEGGKIMRLS